MITPKEATKTPQVTFCNTRKELADRYFAGIFPYCEGNLGIVSLLSDVQHLVEVYFPGSDKEQYSQILNDIKCILCNDKSVPDDRRISPVNAEM